MDAGPLRDPEFRPVSAVPEFSLRDSATVEPEAFMRLVANPFLAAAAWVGWCLAARWLFLWTHAPPGFELIGYFSVVLIILGFFFPFRLLQYHCLDCGHTGRLSRWRDHLCPTIFSRRSSGRVRRFRGPTPPVQVVLWLWAVLAAAMAINHFRS